MVCVVKVHNVVYRTISFYCGDKPSNQYIYEKNRKHILAQMYN